MARTVKCLAATTLLLLLAAARLPGSAATKGDTFTSSLVNDTVPTDGGAASYVKAPGSAVMTLNDYGRGIYQWEVDVYDMASPIKEIKIVNGKDPKRPTVYLLTNVDQPDDPVYFGNTTEDALLAGLEAAGVTEGMAAFFDGSLMGVVEVVKPAKGALIGKIDALPVEDGSFSDIAADNSTENYAESIGDDVSTIYVAQLYNTTVQYFRSGILPSPGTGTLLVFDYKNGTYDWDLQVDLIPEPASAELRLFKTFWDQPVIVSLDPSEPWTPGVTSYTGRIEEAAFKAGMTSTGAYDYIPSGVPSIFNVTPPVVFATVYNQENQTTLGFLFDSSAAPAEKPILKSAAAGTSSWAGLALAAAAAATLLLL